MFGLFKLFSPESQGKDYSDPNLKYLIGRPGETGIVDEIILAPNRKGRVHFRGSYWPAYCDREMVLNPGEVVRVVGIDGITLIVEPIGWFD